MTREEMRQYGREYRAEGFGKIADRRYYQRHREKLLQEAKLRYLKRKARKLSRESGKNL